VYLQKSELKNFYTSLAQKSGVSGNWAFQPLILLRFLVTSEWCLLVSGLVTVPPHTAEKQPDTTFDTARHQKIFKVVTAGAPEITGLRGSRHQCHHILRREGAGEF